jgi:uncharacterized lipoprotein YddW (UPF0748 family)
MRRYLTLLLLLLAIQLAAYMPAEEIRSIWVLPWNISNKESVDTFLARASEARQTDIFIEVRYRADALYKTNRVEDEFPNPEPQSSVLNGSGFDPLGYALVEAHKRNMRVHAWFVVYNSTPVDSTLMARNYIYKNHNDWITFNQKLLRDNPGKNSGHFVDPGLPEVRRYLLDVLGDLLSGYPQLDGLHLDYVRYPSSTLGYHPISVSRFNSVKEILELNWNTWKTLQVTTFVEQAGELARRLVPGITISAAVLADYQEALKYNAQNWPDWLARGLVDFVVPMAYQQNTGDFERILDKIGDLGFKDRIVIGIRAWNDNGNSLAAKTYRGSYDVRDVADRISQVRKLGFAGVSLFSYEGLSRDNALSQLAELAFPAGIDTASVSGASISVFPEGSTYHMELQIPREGRWMVELRNSTGEKLYQSKRYYLEGLNRDYWNGILANGTQIPPGDYQLMLFLPKYVLEYQTPVTLTELKS